MLLSIFEKGNMKNFIIISVEEAKTLAGTDAGVKAGIFAVGLHPWYGFAALMEAPVIHKKSQKKSF